MGSKNLKPKPLYASVDVHLNHKMYHHFADKQFEDAKHLEPDV